MSETANVYDVIVIGAGPVGQNVADRARAAGLTVAVVERELVGGECSYWACIPSKALIRPVIAVADARRVDGAREAVSGPIDPAGVFGRRDCYVSDWDDTGQVEKYLVGIGADLVRGHGRLDGPRRVAVATSDDRLVVLNARHAVAVCTGSRPALPDVPGVAEARPWTNRRATDSSQVPPRLAIVGGGPVGVEMATAWNGLGSAITLLSREPSLLTGFEPFAGELVGLALKESGVDVRTGVTVIELRRPGGTGAVTLVLDDGSELEADEVLVAIGREPHTGDIGLDSVGLSPGSWLDVDDTCLVRGVGDEWLYAVGDVNHRALLTHQGKYQARIVGTAIGLRAAGRPVDTTPWGTHATTADHHAVPQVVFTDPEIGAVGDRRAALRRYVPGSGADGRRPRPRAPARRDLRRGRRVRATALGDHRRRSRGAYQPALARRAVVPDHQRGLAAPARGLPRLKAKHQVRQRAGRGTRLGQSLGRPGPHQRDGDVARRERPCGAEA